jgi:hypothetical protein
MRPPASRLLRGRRSCSTNQRKTRSGAGHDGLTPLRTWRFAVATFLGIIPASLLLAHFGDEFASGNLWRAGVTVLVLGRRMECFLGALPIGVEELVGPRTGVSRDGAGGRQPYSVTGKLAERRDTMMEVDEGM